MSSISGLTSSKTDKNKAKFKTIDINNVYKGTSVGPARTAGTYNHVIKLCLFDVFFCSLANVICRIYL
jgi:hypothetical protein